MHQLASHSFLSDEGAVGTVERDHPLAPMTRYRLGGRAEWLVRPQSLVQLSRVVSQCHCRNIPLRILGAGANVLIDDDGVDGVVVRLDAPCFAQVEWNVEAASRNGRKERGVCVRVGAGVGMGRLTLDSVRRGLSGLECMAGIPGSVGGCIRMNAGGRWGEIAGVIRDVTIIEPLGQIRTISGQDVGFSYRRTELNGAIICAATLELSPGDPQEILARYKEIWSAKNAGQPLAAHSAGCVFKNPPGDSAGRLIDAAGLKNRMVGAALVSPEHANFIVVREGGTAGDVLELISLVRRTVADKFAVNLELEVEVWQRNGKPLPWERMDGGAAGSPAPVRADRRSASSQTELVMTRLAQRPVSRTPARSCAVRTARKTQTLAITVLSGGPSNEREVSLKSGQAVARALETLGHQVTLSDISPEHLDALDIPADLVFVALHGEFGEDGRVQRLLEERGIRYTGSGAAASALAMDKVATKYRFVEREIPTPKFDVVTPDHVDHVVDRWSLPVVLKPVAEGSSIDISIVRDDRALRSELQRLTGQYGRCLLEAFVEGYELTVGVLGGQALPPIEIRTRREFYDYQAKYIDDDTEYRFDIDLPPGVLAHVQEMSIRAHEALGCRHFSRVDWLVDRATHQPYALEVNTIPGFTDHSLLPKAAARAGLSFPQLCGRIIELATS